MRVVFFGRFYQYPFLEAVQPKPIVAILHHVPILKILATLAIKSKQLTVASYAAQQLHLQIKWPKHRVVHRMCHGQPGVHGALVQIHVDLVVL